MQFISWSKKTPVFNTNLKKQLLSEFDQKFKIKFQEFSKFVANKKTLMTIIYKQCDKATETEFPLRANYNADCQAGNLIKSLGTKHRVRVK